MQVDDPLSAFPTGPRGVAGDLLARLEQEALVEQARLDAIERGEKPAPAAVDDRPTYVPGLKRVGAGVSASAAAPVSSTSAAKDSNTNTTSNATTTTAARHPSPAEPPIKKPRIQPTIRMQFTFPPYPPGRDPIAKHVPIFNVRDLAQSKGLLLPSEDTLIEEGSSSGGSDDEGGEEEASGVDMEGAEASASNIKPKEDETDSQRQLREAIEMARRSKKPVLGKKRILDRDEGYDAEDPFVDDSELAMNEPKVQARPKVEGYVAIQGEVEVYDNNLSSIQNQIKKDDNKNNTAASADNKDVDGKGRKGRKAGSVNRPKVPMTMPDGSVKLVSEAVAAREAKKVAKADGKIISGPGAPDSASASPAPPGSPSKASSSTTSHHYTKPENESVPPPSHNFSSLNPNGPLMSRDAVPYSHLPSSTSFGFPDTDAKTAAETPPPPSRNGTETGGPSAPPTSRSAIGSRTSPIQLDDDGDIDMSFATSANATFANKAPSTSAPPSSSSAQQPPRQNTNVFAFDPSPNKKDGKRVYEYAPVTPTLENQLEVLRQAVSKESFVPKNKFPPHIKPILMETALTAMRTGEYDDNFFNIMPNIFPYNRFTMHKMIKREVCEIRCSQLEAEIGLLVEEFKVELDKILPEAMKLFEEQHQKWEEEMKIWRMETGNSASDQNTATPAADGQQNVRNSLTPVGSDGDLIPPLPQSDANAANAAPPEPQPKFRFTQGLRMCLFKIMTLSAEVTERQMDKATVEEKDPPSAMNATKARYATLVQLWPEGWMTSNQLSRELTQAKKKVASQMNR